MNKSIKLCTAMLIAILLILVGVSALADTVWYPVEDPIGDNAYVSDLIVQTVIDGTGPFDADDKPGNDSGNKNKIVRTFDNVYYTFKANIAKRDGAPDYSKAFLCFAAEVPFSSKQIEFKTDNFLENSTFEIVETTGAAPSQTLYVRMPLGGGTACIVPGTQEFPLTLYVKNLADGTAIRPTFYAWLQGNDVYENGADSPADITSVDFSRTNSNPCEEHKDTDFKYELKKTIGDDIRVSAKLKMNIAFKFREGEYVNTLNFNTGNTDPNSPSPAVNYGEGELFSTVAAFGMAVCIENDVPDKKLRGLLYPEGPITFDLKLNATYHPENKEAIDITSPTSEYDYSPLLFSYGVNKYGNENADGRSVPLSVNMPLCSPSNVPVDQPFYKAVYNGGNWKAVQSGNIVTITITDYEINGDFPYSASQYASSNMFEEHTGCFSVGELYFALPHDDRSGNSTEANKEISNRFGIGDYYFGIYDINLNASAPSATEPDGFDSLESCPDGADNQTNDDDDVANLRCYLSAPGTYSPIIHYSKYNSTTTNDISALTAGCFHNGYDWSLPGAEIGIVSGYIEFDDGGDPRNKLIGYDDFLKIDADAVSFLDVIDDPENALENGNPFDYLKIPVKDLVKPQGVPDNPDGTVDFVMHWVRHQNYYADYRILYAVKTDGTNWASDAEMCAARPEDANLKWFTRLDDAEDAGAVVGLLFQYRGNEHEMGGDNSRVIYPRYKVAAKINEDVAVDETYMITHFARAWTRKLLGQDKLNEIAASSDPGKEYATAIPLYTVVDGKLVVNSTDNQYGEFWKDGKYTALINTAYNRLVYHDDGSETGGNGDNKYGDTVYIPPYAPAIKIEPLNGTTDLKNTFTTSMGSIADFQLTPTLRLPTFYETAESSATANVTITVDLPKGLTYIRNSSYWGGEYALTGAGNQGTIQNPAIHLTEDTYGKDEAYLDKWIYRSGEKEYPIYISMQAKPSSNGTKTVLTYRFAGLPLSECTNGLCNALSDYIHFSCVIDDNDETTYWELNETATIDADGITVEHSETNRNVSRAAINVTKLKAEGLSIVADNLYNEQDGELGWTATYQNNTNVDNNNALFFTRIGKNGYAGSYTFSDWSLDLDKLRGDGSGLQLWYTTESVEGKSAEDFSADALSAAGFTKVNSLSKEGSKLTADLSLCGQVTGWILTGPLKNQSVFSVHMGIKPTGNVPGDLYIAYDSFKTGSTSPLTSNDRAYVVGREISGLVWYDKNYNGIREDNESVVPGVTVELYKNSRKLEKDVTGADIPVTVTDLNGAYSFSKLPAGNYTVRFVNWPEDYSGITRYQVVGADASVNSDAITIGHITQTRSEIEAASANEIGSRFIQRHEHIDLGLIKLGELDVQKTVEGEIPDSEADRAFSFTLQLTIDGTAYSQPILLNGDSVTPAADGKVEFTLKANETAAFSGICLGTAYTVTEAEAPFYTPSFTNASGTIGETKIFVACKNNYLPSPAEYAPYVTKELDGQTPPADTEFTFTVTHTSGNADGLIMPIAKSISITGPATAAFDPISFVKAGTYGFSITEAATDAHGYYNDANGAWTLTVTVSDINGTLTVESHVYSRNQETSEDSATFTNTYIPDPVTHQISVNKRIEGSPAQEETYTFELTGENVAQTYVILPRSTKATVTGEGTATFDPITFHAAGTYAFTVREIAGDTANCTYDSSVLSVLITVTDTDGKLSVTQVRYEKDGEDSVPEFVNAYQAGSLRIEKTVEGNDGELDRAWHFRVMLMDHSGEEYKQALRYDGSYTGTVTSGDTVTLKHGEAIVIHSIPEGITYTVTETDANADGYTTTSEGAAGIIANGKTAKAHFTNTRTKTDVPKTGDYTALSLLAVSLTVSLAAIVFITRRKALKH